MNTVKWFFCLSTFLFFVLLISRYFDNQFLSFLYLILGIFIAFRLPPAFIKDMNSSRERGEQ